MPIPENSSPGGARQAPFSVVYPWAILGSRLGNRRQGQGSKMNRWKNTCLLDYCLGILAVSLLVLPGKVLGDTWSTGTSGVISTPTTTKVGIGTSTPNAQLQIFAPNSHNWINLDRTSSAYETGMQFSENASVKFWFFMDNTSANNLQIQSASLSAQGETDATPRIRFPGGYRDIEACLSGGNLGVGVTNPGQVGRTPGFANRPPAMVCCCTPLVVIDPTCVNIFWRA